MQRNNPENPAPARCEVTTRSSRVPLILFRGLAALLLVCFPFLFGGCSSKSSPPRPRLAQQADQLALQAAQLQALGNWAGAAVSWERAGRTFQLLNQMTNLAVALHNEGVCRQALGQFDAARALLDHAGAINERIHQSDAWWRNQIALVQLDEIQSSVGAAERIANLQPRTNSIPFRSAEVLALWEHEVARVQLAQGELDQAHQSLDRAGAAFSEIGDLSGVAAVAVIRARVLQQQELLPEAEAKWREALSRYERLAEPRGIATALGGLGSCLLSQGNLVEGQTLLQRAAQNFHTLGMEEQRIAAENELHQFTNPGGK